MKKILYAAMLLLGLSILSSCNKEQTNSNDYSKLILGAWLYTYSETFENGELISSRDVNNEFYTFDTDGICDYEFLGHAKHQYQYSINGNNLIIAGYVFKIHKLTSKELIIDISFIGDCFDRCYFIKKK